MLIAALAHKIHALRALPWPRGRSGRDELAIPVPGAPRPSIRTRQPSVLRQAARVSAPRKGGQARSR